MLKLKPKISWLKNISLLSLVAWVSSIVIFLGVVNLFNSTAKNGIYSSSQSSIIISIMAVGVLAFALMFISFVVFQLEKDDVKIKKTSGRTVKSGGQLTKERFLIICIVFLLLIVVYLYGKGNSAFLNSSRVEDRNPIPTFTIPTDIPTPSPTPEYVPKYIAPTIDPDPPVLCNVNPNCGGGTTPLRQSECNNSTCCQVGDKWVFYKDKVQCGRDQEAQSNRGNPVPQNTQQTQGNNYYCWNNAYGYSYYTSSGDQCNLDNLKATTYKICNDTQRMKADSCDSGCNGLSVNDGAGNDPYADCLGKCTDQYKIDLTQCHL